jgi:hypothetical protein
MPTCTPPGWSSSGWGWDAWGGGGPLQQDLPVHLPFDVYCVGPCEEIGHIFEFFLVGGSGSLQTDPLTGNLWFDSGGQGSAASEEWLEITKTIPSTWTLEYTVKFHHLPPQLTSIQQAMGHVWVGVWNEQGASAGLFFSAAGIGYAAHQDDPIIPIPNSENLIDESNYWTVRVVGSTSTGALFIYVTKSADLDAGGGHMLRFVLPVPAQTGSHQEHTYVSVLGTPQIHNELELQGICLASSPVIPNMPPIADAGNDQELRLCTIGQLDGSASYDPEGAPVTCYWRLTDVPVTSSSCFEGYDGWTEADPSGFVNELHTRNSLDPLAGGRTVSIGDVLVVKGGAYTIQQVITTDPLDQIVQIDGYYLPAGESFPHYFKLVQQQTLNGATNTKPTFYPDVAGFWRFDLTVSDGQLSSEPAVVVVSVRESPVPRGYTPDVSFIWSYLSDFWKLVGDKDSITTVWSAVAQIVASELLKLWQVDYNKSLRDIQRTMVRKWLYYDVMVQEPFFDLTTVPCLNVTNGMLSGSGGQILPAQPPPPWPAQPLPLQMNPYGYRTNVRLDDKGIQRGDLLVLNGQAYRIDKLLPLRPHEPLHGAYRGELVLLDPIYEIPSTDPLPSCADWSIVKPTTSSQIDFWGGLVVGSATGQLGDDAVVEVLDKQTGAYQFIKCRVLGVCSQMPHGMAIDPTDWSAYALDQTGRYELYFVSVFRRHYLPISDRIRDIPYLQQQINNPPVDEVLHRNVDFFIETFRGRSCIRFADVWKYPVDDGQGGTTWQDDPTPPARLWGEFNYIENLSVVESNFGGPAGLTVDGLAQVSAQMPGDVDYLSAVQGLWYVYFNSASPYNIRVGAQILLGLPFAESDGTITEIIPNLNVSATRMLVSDADANGIVRAYDFPDGLNLETNPETGAAYAVGDSIKQFAPISTGVDVVDYVKDPYWIAPYIGQGSFSEIQKYFYFPVIIEDAAFTLAGALLTRTLVLNVKPSYTYPIVVAKFAPDEVDIDVEEDLIMTVSMKLHEGPCTHFAQSHPHMWNAGDTGPVTVFPHPDDTDTSLTSVWHRHESYPGWCSSWKSQYGIKNYPDVGYADFYETDVSGVMFPYDLPTMPAPDGSFVMFVQAQPYDFTPQALYVEVTINTPEPDPIYTIELLIGGVSFVPPFTATFSAVPPPGSRTFNTTVTFPTAVPVAGDQPITAQLTVGPGGSGQIDWVACRFILYVTYLYTSPNWWGHYTGSNQQYDWPHGQHPPHGGGDVLCPEQSLELTTYADWSASAVVQYGSIFMFGTPVYPAYVDTSGLTPILVVDWASPTHSVAPGTGDPGWSFGQTLDPPDPPYTGYVSHKFV